MFAYSCPSDEDRGLAPGTLSLHDPWACLVLQHYIDDDLLELANFFQG